MLYSETEKAWLKRRAWKIVAETGDPLPAACSAAIAEFMTMQQRPKGRVIPFRRRKPARA